MQNIGFYIYGIFIGALGGIHIPINGAFGARIGSALVATWVFFGVAFVLSSVAMVIDWNRPAIQSLSSVPVWFYLAGAISVIVVSGGTFLIPKIGAVNLFVLVLSSQLISRSVISHFGLLESPVTPINVVRVIGFLFLIVGAVLVVKR